MRNPTHEALSHLYDAANKVSTSEFDGEELDIALSHARQVLCETQSASLSITQIKSAFTDLSINETRRMYDFDSFLAGLAFCGAYSGSESKPSIRQALALPPTGELNLSDPAVQKRLAAQWGYVLPTAAPEMPLSMNQFGRLVELTREHLTDNTFVYKATSKAGDTCHFGVESAAKAWAKGGTVEAIKVREFKLHTSGPTSDHLPNAGKMINGLTQAETDASVSVSGLTAAPVGERDLAPVIAYRLDYPASEGVGLPRFFGADDGERAHTFAFNHKATITELCDRAALSAGNAVDGVPGVETVAWMFTDPPMMGGRTEFRTDPENVTPHWTPLSATAAVQQYKEDAQRYRWLREQSDDDFAFAVVKTPHFDVYESPEELDSAIDAAMRKGQL